MSKKRHRYLLVFDVEGTLFKTTVRLKDTILDSTIWQGLALALGPKAVKAEVATHIKWRTGEYPSYLDWMKDTIQIHQKNNLSFRLFNEVIKSAQYNPGVTDFFKSFNRDGFEIVLVSGGFRELARRAQQDLKIHHAFSACEYFFGRTGKLEGYNLLPCDFEGKIDFIRLMLREYDLKDDQWIFVGDGANDVPIAKAAPLSIAYRAHPDLKKIATTTVERFAEIKSIIEKY